jgi:hypothetical protein
MVIQYHYAAGGSKTAVACFGLFRAAEVKQFGAKCYGVTWWIPPTRDAAAATYPGNPNGVLALSRMAIHPDAPRNAASFLLMRSVKQLEARWECLVTYADQWQGHTGAIYRAANWQYIGLTDPEWVYVNTQGRMMGRKRGDHTFRHQQMLDMGFIAKGPYSKHKFVYIRENKRSKEIECAMITLPLFAPVAGEELCSSIR